MFQNVFTFVTFPILIFMLQINVSEVPIDGFLLVYSKGQNKTKKKQ